MGRHKTYYRETSESSKLAMKLYLEGRSMAQIAQATGRTEGGIRTMLARARRAGQIPRATRGNGIEYLCRKSGVRMGTSREITANLNREQVEWLFSEALKYKTRSVSEYITEIIRDAYEEEMERRHGNK